MDSSIDPQAIFFFIVLLISALRSALDSKKKDQQRKHANSTIKGKTVKLPKAQIPPAPPVNTDKEPVQQPHIKPTKTPHSSNSTAPIKKQTRHRKTSIKQLLHTPGSTQNAIILTEVLGKPKGLQ